MLRLGAVQMILLAGPLVLPAQQAASDGLRIRTVDIIHHAHTDVGFTDLPSVSRELHARYIDVAVDICAQMPGSTGRPSRCWGLTTGGVGPAWTGASCSSNWFARDRLK
jgi:hypothetical protein